MSITLRSQADGKVLEAVFAPETGMNMLSYRLGDVEVIDQSTKTLFDERFAGLGALIGPHFHRRNPSILRPVKDEAPFPHIARVKARGVQDPFSHGIARYAPWTVKASTETTLHAVLTGKDLWNGIPLAELEGQNFKMTYDIALSSKGLQLNLSVASDTDSLVGIHFYYHLPQGTGTVSAKVRDIYLDDGHPKKIPGEWPYNSADHQLVWDLSQPADYTFHPAGNPLEGHIVLDAKTHRLVTRYACPSQENCWQLWRPVDQSFVCIEPISAQDPHHPNLTVSSQNILLTIESP